MGDILLAVDDATVRTSSDLAKRISRHLSGDSVSIRLSRKGVELSKTVVLKPRPFETSPGADVFYTSVVAGGSRRRVIVTRPKTSDRHPAVLLISGLGCYSLDGEMSRPSGYGSILATLAKNNGMSSAYMQQIGDLSLGKRWKSVDIPALVIYGTSDPATSADEGRYLAELINSFMLAERRMWSYKEWVTISVGTIRNLSFSTDA